MWAITNLLIPPKTHPLRLPGFEASVESNLTAVFPAQVLLDELGRSTSSADGFAIAWGCCEMLLRLRAYTVVATHMPRLCELATLYPNVKTGARCKLPVESN